MVADQHRLADFVRRVDAAGRVGQHNCSTAGGAGDAYCVHDRGHAMAFVQVGAAEQDEGVQAGDLHGSGQTGVPRDRGRREAGEFLVRPLRLRGTERIRGRHPAGAEHDGDVVRADFSRGGPYRIRSGASHGNRVPHGP